MGDGNFALMSWLSDIATIVRGNRVAELKAATDEWKALKQEYKEEVLSLRDKVKQMEKEIMELQESESDCHKQLIKMRQDHRDMKERLIFTENELKRLNKK